MKIPRIVEIIRRADQGATRPFICRADDGKTYYVKGKSASTGERIREWMGSNLAAAFGLPVPEMAVLEVSKSLIEFSSDEAKSDLGVGYAVGSQMITAVDELHIDDLPMISPELQQEILLFDCWLQNEDRTLSVFGGNPNLLYQEKSGKLYAIDYNLILPAHFDRELFRTTHVFRGALSLDSLSNADKYAFEQKMQQALQVWEQSMQCLPESWLEENETTAAFDFENMLKLLTDAANGAIWRTDKS